MYARLVKSESDDYYEGEQSLSSTEIDAFTFQGFIIPEEFTAENILKNQELFHKFNVEINSTLKGREYYRF